MKDFNKLMINGINYSRDGLLKRAFERSSGYDFEKDFWNFIRHWFDSKAYILIESSGSTGKPKKVKLSKEKMMHSAAMTCKFLKLKKDQSALLCLSTKHIGGVMMVLRAMYAQLNLHVVQAKSNPLRGFNKPIDFIAIVPYQAVEILQHNPNKLKSIKHIIIGGGKVNVNLKQALLEHKIEAYSTFGMTETISHIALQKIGKEDNYTCLPGISLSLSPRETLVIHAPSLLDAPLETNDLVQLHSPTSFTWLGRADFAIESGGLKFIPELIEQKLEMSIAERFIISSRSHEQLNNELILIIESKESIFDETIFNKLAKFEKPKRIFFVKKFIEGANGKIDRRKTTNLIGA